MTVAKRWGNRGQLYATYTWSRAIDDAPEQNNIDSTAFLSDSTNRRQHRADSLTDKRHAFNLTGVLQPCIPSFESPGQRAPQWELARVYYAGSKR